MLLSSASLYVCRIIKEKKNTDFYYGKYILEPVVIAINSFVLIIMCSSSMINSIKTILNGGNLVNAGAAIIYSIISTLGCGIVYFMMVKRNKKEKSALIGAESAQWKMDFLLSFAVFIGFILTKIATNIGYINIAKYMDPSMVLVASILCIKGPIKRFIRNTKEVFGQIKPEKINKQVTKIANNLKKEYGFDSLETDVKKIGRSIKIIVEFSNKTSESDMTIDEMNEIKHSLYNKIDTGKYYKDLEVLFTMGDNISIEITV